MAVVGVREPGVRSRRTLGGTVQKPLSCLGSHSRIRLHLYYSLCYLQAFKHIFTSPSSVEKEAKATRSGNARIHGMTRVTTASLAYVATQVRLASGFYQPTEYLCSFASHCHLHRYSVGLIPQQTLNDSTRASWTSWMIRRRQTKLVIC
jgi:hypothetical protein